MTTLYGISNCDTIKKARQWLDQQGIDYRYHDFRKDGIDQATIASWCQQLGWETLLNKRGTTWRKLDPQVQQAIDASNAAELLAQQPAMIKRPVLDIEGQLTVGFNETQYQSIFN